MVDTVTSELIENGQYNFIYRLTNVSDGTGESGVTKVDGSSSGPLGVNVGGQIFYPGAFIRIREIDYDIHNMGLRILWDAGTPVTAVVLGGFGKLPRGKFGGINIPLGTVGATGKILFTTLGAMPNSSYTVIMRGTKGVPQS